MSLDFHWISTVLVLKSKLVYALLKTNQTNGFYSVFDEILFLEHPVQDLRNITNSAALNLHRYFSN